MQITTAEETHLPDQITAAHHDGVSVFLLKKKSHNVDILRISVTIKYSYFFI